LLSQFDKSACFLRTPILWHPILHLLGCFIVDAPHQTSDIEDEVLLGVPLDVHREKLYVITPP
jgi:hypothetical protein